MAPPKDKPSKAPREEFEVAYYTKELGRPLQRKMLQKRFDAFSTDSHIKASSHGEESSKDKAETPREDRAG